VNKDTAILIPARNEVESLKRLIPLLVLSSQRIKEILIVVDSSDDTSLQLMSNPEMNGGNVKFVVSGKKGIAEALAAGVVSSKSEYILICMADEILPVLVIDSFIEKLVNGASLVSATRYRGGGRRYGGSLFGHIASRTANWMLFRVFFWGISDSTSGMKAFRKADWATLSKNISYGGWAPALALTRNARSASLKIEEVPVISVDRVIGGQSSFRFWYWVKQYGMALFGKQFQ
jgi:glycosyltransferase involved in cell wall biosynthesis